MLAEELHAQGAAHVAVEPGGVAFAGNLATAYAVNLHSRLASRVLWEVARAPYASEHDLYAAAMAVPWEDHFGARHLLRVDVTATRSPLRSLEFATLRIKDAVVDRLRDRTGSRPSIDRARPDVRVFAHLGATDLTLYLDLSGEPLFKRGWRADKGEAPLKENLAAGLLALAGWTPSQPLLDPFCGSGTIVIEAAQIAARRAPGLQRGFGFERLNGFERRTWMRLLDEARGQVDDQGAVRIAGSDISTRVVAQARANAALAGLQRWLDDGRLALVAGDARVALPIGADGMIIANPPYGEQSNPKSASVASLMGNVGDRLKQAFTGWEAWFLTSDRALPRQLHLHETRKTVLFNGPLECRFFRFELVSGGYRPRAKPAATETPRDDSSEPL